MFREGSAQYMKSAASAFPMKWRDHVINDGLAHKWKLILQRGKIRHSSKNCGVVLHAAATLELPISAFDSCSDFAAV